MLRALITGACVLATLAGCATAPAHSNSTASATANPACLSTGSRIPQGQNSCAAFGQSYTEEQLRQTGRWEVGPALQTLDPAVTVR